MATTDTSGGNKKFECTALPKGWIREEVIRKGGLSAGKYDVYYYPPAGKPKIRSKPELIKFIGDTFDLSCFDYGTGNMLSTLIKPRGRPLGRKTSKEKKAKSDQQADANANKSTKVPSLIPPIRQTASIFKQPVTVVKGQQSKVKNDFKQPGGEKPRQLFWEKRLDGIGARVEADEVFQPMRLPDCIKTIDPVDRDGDYTTNILLASISTALHIGNNPITGQVENKENKNPAIFVSPDQPLISSLEVSEADILAQEKKVIEARNRLAEAVKTLQ